LSTRAQVDAKGEHRSIVAALKKIIRTEGIPGLYSGIQSALFGIGITNGTASLGGMLTQGIYYWWYEWSKEVIEKAAIRSSGKRRPLTTAESMLAGLIAGSATVILTNPIWVVNTRETTRKNEVEEKTAESLKDVHAPKAAKQAVQKHAGFLKILINIIKTEGIGTLWSGVVPALILVANPIIQYTVFEQLKNAVERRRGSRLLPNDAFILGALGKLLATGITYPYSTIAFTSLLS
jgi:solute carrier family 25 (peroxisomal adenine nucleotide transporter), member 17